MCFFWKQFHLAWTRNICLKVVLVGWFIYIYRYDIINVTDSIQITLWANWMLFANLQLYVFFTLKIITVVWAITCILCVFLRWVVFNFQVNRIYIYIHRDYRIIDEFMDHGEGSEMYPCTGQAVLSSTVIAAPWKVNMTQRLHVLQEWCYQCYTNGSQP